MIPAFLLSVFRTGSNPGTPRPSPTWCHGTPSTSSAPQATLVPSTLAKGLGEGRGVEWRGVEWSGREGEGSVIGRGVSIIVEELLHSTSIIDS